MIAGSNCNCLVCQLERNLGAELGREDAVEEYRLRTPSSPALRCFSSPLELVGHLHTPGASGHSSSGDPTLLELLRLSRRPGANSMWQQILLLVFIPTIHRTTSLVLATFPSLARDDISQHALATLLEFLGSQELQTRHSHIAFAIARKLRRLAFRWAIRESQGATRDDSEGPSVAYTDDPAAPEAFPAGVLLYEFLDDCQRAGRLSPEERDLLLQLKIEGLSCQELSQRNGHSAVAIRHRMHRLLTRLRRQAKTPPARVPQQLELFPP